MSTCTAKEAANRLHIPLARLLADARSGLIKGVTVDGEGKLAIPMEWVREKSQAKFNSYIERKIAKPMLYYTAAEVARKTGLSPSIIQRHLAKGAINGAKKDPESKHWMVPETWVENYLTEKALADSTQVRDVYDYAVKALSENPGHPALSPQIKSEEDFTYTVTSIGVDGRPVQPTVLKPGEGGIRPQDLTVLGGYTVYRSHLDGEVSVKDYPSEYTFREASQHLAAIGLDAEFAEFYRLAMSCNTESAIEARTYFRQTEYNVYVTSQFLNDFKHLTKDQAQTILKGLTQ